jgi:hypothetical protein
MGGGALIGGNAMIKCKGTDVVDELNDVFGDPNDKYGRYAYAQENNTFDKVATATVKPYRALLAAYAAAGVDICGRWRAYLRTLPDQEILDIADVRYTALTAGVPIVTSTHLVSGGRLKKKKGTSKTDPSTIDAPFDPV